MGCSAAKNLAVEPLNGELPNGTSESRKASITRRPSEIPPLEGDEPTTEMLETGTVNNVQKTNNGLSFDIAFEEEGESIIKKHPPRRFQKLEDEQTSPTLSLARLQEKLDEAEIRRQQILKNRVTSAKTRKGIRKQNNEENNEESGDEENEEDSNHLKVPPDITSTTNPYDVSYI